MMKDYHSICVAGSHGKTTTTTMLSAMLNAYRPTGYIIGDGSGYIENESKNFVLEACEFRRHFLAYHPDYAIITNIEIDHVDYFKDEEDYRLAYQQFSKNVRKKLVVFGDDLEVRKCQFECDTVYYGLQPQNDYYAAQIVETSKNMEFDFYYQGEFLYHFNLPFVGRHLLWNSLAVITIGVLEQIPFDQIESGLKLFHGAKRRFVVEEVKENVFIDDYAHHPTEVSITIDAAKKRFPDKKLVAIFKPHRASRVAYFIQDFANALKKADQVFLCDFTSIDDRNDGVEISIEDLQKKIPNSQVLSEDDLGAMKLAELAPAVYLFMSSKDIYHLADKVKAIHLK